jgi:succinate dehydrogenase / fumarate reductase cytochrome b subunit
MNNRPLSPHLSIYRPQITSVLSIFHRITGAGLFFSSILFVIWISSVAVGLNYYNFVESIFSKPVILLILTVSLWALWYHSLTGLRHLYWDLGFGFDLKSVYLSGWIAILFSFFITAINIVIISYI